MKYLLACYIFLTLAYSVNGQTVQELNNQVIEFYHSKEFEKAVPLAKKIVVDVKDQYGELSKEYCTVLNNLALIYVELKQLDTAEGLFLNVIDLQEQMSAEDDAAYFYSLNDLAKFYVDRNQYDKSIPLYLKVLQKQKKIFGDESIMYAQCLNHLAGLYQKMELYQKSEPFYLEMLAIYKKAAGDSLTDYAKCMNDLAWTYKNMGQFKKAEPLFISAIDIQKKLTGAAHPYYATYVSSLGGLYADMGNYEKAESLYLESIKIKKILLGVLDYNYAISLNNLGLLYTGMSRNDKAETLFSEALFIFDSLAAQASAAYASCVNNLGWLYMKTGRYEKAELLFVNAMEIKKKGFGEHSSSYANSQTSLALLYTNMGRYEKAEPLYLNAMAIYVKVLGSSHPDYATCVDNLAALYQNSRRFTQAETLFIEALEIRKKELGIDNPDYALSLNNLAMLYREIGKYKLAVQLCEESLTIREKSFGNANPYYATGLNNLALLYGDLGDYEKAEPLLLKAMAIWKKTLGEFHPNYASSLNNLAALYVSTVNYSKAEPFLIQNSKIVIHNLKNNFANLSEQEKQSYLNNTIILTQTNNSFLYKYRNASQNTIAQVANAQLFLKGMVLDDTKKIFAVLQNSKDTSLVGAYANWLTSKNNLSKQYALPIAQRSIDLKTLEEKTEILEKYINRRSTEFKNQQNAVHISMKDIGKVLRYDEVAIEFVKFHYYNQEWTDSSIYAAYILRKNDSVPKFVPLCEEKQLGKYFSSTAGSANIKAIYRSDAIDEEDQPSLSGDSLYALVWKPLMPYLKGIQKINYAPAGLLYKIAFNALPTGDSSLLMDKFELNQFTSTRQLAISEDKAAGNNSIALFGNCLFSMDSSMIVKNIPADENANTLITVAKDRGKSTGGWKQLEGTAKEIASIKSLFDTKKISNKSFEAETATEEQFKLLSGNSPAIIHLATHGFFLPDPEEKRSKGAAADSRNAFTLADDPLLRSGIVLSGANRVWSGETAIAGREDGIVTAYEIAQMDLSRTDLVVLSACETALGDIKGNEGVFGLQRAFKLAGVKNMILSLWKVPDAETAELMKIFYGYYLNDKTVRDSFAAAQKEMRKKYAPYYWAAFVLIE